MKLILQLMFVWVLLSTASLFANINECTNDLYYANGIMMNETETNALKNWKKEAQKLFIMNPKISSKIANILVAYNRSQGFDDDIFESFEQMMGNEWGWTDFSNYFKLYLQTRLIQQLGNQHSLDLTTQVNNYKQSIKDGHGVIVIAHSQGNYFTNEAYEELDEWMKEYFHMFGVATPANHVAGFPAGDNTAPYVKFHNDIIKLVVTGLPSNLEDPNEEHNQNVSYAAHNFYDSYLTAENSKTKILNFILSKIEEHSSASSQWQTDQEYDIDTMNYRITVKHRFDPSIIMNEEVYPFSPSKKLYQAKDESGALQYVKASCGGTEISASWEGQVKGEFYLLEGTGEKIERKEKGLTFGPISMTKIIYEENPPATVKSIECWLPTYKKTYETYQIRLENSIVKKELINRYVYRNNLGGSYPLIDGQNSYYVNEKYGCSEQLRECYVTDANLEEYLRLLATNVEVADFNQTVAYKYPGYPTGMQHAYSIRTMILDDGTKLYEGYEFIYSKTSAEDAKQQTDIFLGITGQYMRSCESTEFDKEFNNIYDTKVYGAYF